MRQLTADDICKGHYAQGKKKCFLGWLNTKSNYAIILDAWKLKTGIAIAMKWNDDPKTPVEDIVKALNEICPEGFNV